MNRKKKAVAIALAAMMACGTLAGCDALTTINSNKDYSQVIAEVDLSQSKQFEAGERYAAYEEIVESAKSTIVKKDLISLYISSGYSLQQEQGFSTSEIFSSMMDYLVNRQVSVQYAMVYLADQGDAEGNRYTVSGYKQALAAVPATASDAQREAMGIAYFLEEEEEQKAEYDLKVFINNSIDSIEKEIIAIEEGNHDHTPDSEVRAVPNGAETENEDYYDAKYGIYTGKQSLDQLGSYEMVEDSTRSTRKKAYNRFLSNLRANSILEKGENTSNFESLNYYWTQLRTNYEEALLNKLTEKYEKIVSETINEQWATEQYQENVQDQVASYGTDKALFETAFNGISDTAFVLSPYNVEYGYVINILLPFSTVQQQELNEASNDFGDNYGNKFATRAGLLRGVLATDQRATWFTGHDDYSFAAAADAYTNGDANRNKLFFENSFEGADAENKQYETLKNYYGKYTFNGTVEKEDGDYVITPNKITIDGFLSEMKNYLASAGLNVNVEKAATEAYYAQSDYYFPAGSADGKEGEVNYEKFIYEMGKIDFFNNNYYNASEIFLPGSEENTSFSIINELSFAYNTDTAGLNSYLGYMISPYATDFVPEFEYAGQQVVKSGAGSYAVVPSDYGWHIIYCTFSYKDAAQAGKNAFDFVWGDIEKEGSFSYNYYEALKSTTVSSFANNMQQEDIIPYLDDCTTIYEERFAELLNNK